MQFQYYNQRRKVIRSVLGDNNESCKIDNNTVYEHFSKIFSVPNNNLCSEYSNKLSDSERVINDKIFNLRITKEEVSAAVKGMAVDTAPGPDHILVRAIKDDLAYEAISLIATKMLESGQVPPCLQKARTVLVPKPGNNKEARNWRPITIFSVFRRVIDRILDRRLRQYISFNEYQTGFSKTPGSLINTSILQSVLHAAKNKKCNLTVVFLDIAKAFDNVGHDHLNTVLDCSPAPTKLTELIKALQKGNTTQIEINRSKTKKYKYKQRYHARFASITIIV